MKYFWGLFYVQIVDRQFTETLLGVNAEQSKLIDYANSRPDFQLNSHFDPAKGRYRIEDMTDFYRGIKTEVFRSFPFLIRKVYIIE